MTQKVIVTSDLIPLLGDLRDQAAICECLFAYQCLAGSKKQCSTLALCSNIL